MRAINRMQMMTKQKISSIIFMFSFLVIASAYLIYKKNMYERDLNYHFFMMNKTLPYSMLAYDIERKNIRIYSLSPIDIQPVLVGGFKVIPIYLAVKENEWDYVVNFIVNNHQAVVMFAIRMWDENPELSKWLLQALYNSDPNAQTVIDDYRKNGKLTTSRNTTLEMYETFWRGFVKNYLDLRPNQNINDSQELPFSHKPEQSQ